jgi:predicted extracellular nuclease
MRNLSLFALVVVGLVACRGGGDGDDQVTPDGPIGGGDVTIQEIQNDAMPACTPSDPAACVELTVKGVVVLAVDTYGARTGDFWVGEPDGGPFSGIKVYNAPIDQVAGLAPGDLVDITGGVKDEFALMEDTSGRKVTEIKPANGGMLNVTKVGTIALPAPAMIDGAALATKTQAEQDMEWEKWEGVLITVTNAKQVSDIKSFGAGGDDQKEFDIAAGEVAVQSALTALPTSAIANTCYAGITGIGDYFFNYLVFPRNASDLVSGGTGCAATMATTITAIQTAATPPAGSMELKDVYVAAVSYNKKNLWVQTNLTAAPNEGIYVYGTGATLSFTVGQRVNIIGTVEEFNDATGTETLTEFKAQSITAGTAGTGTLVPITGVESSTLGETHESVLVTLTNVTVSTLGVPCAQGTMPPACNYGVGAVTDAPSATPLTTDDDIAVLGPVNTCYATVKGVWTYLVYSNTWGFLPLATTGTGTCP